jgi:predicted DNA-binding WGR domain protein
MSLNKLAADVVFGEDGETPYQANLVQVNMATNTDKYYDLTIEQGTSDVFNVVQHWGRTGTDGQQKIDRFEDLPGALKFFENKFKSKTGARFADRETYVAGANKYSFKAVDREREEVEGVVWEYYIDDGVDGKADGWYPYAKAAGDMVEGIYHEWQKNDWLCVRCVQSGYWSYRVDFNSMEQNNTSTKKLRKIRRTTPE